MKHSALQRDTLVQERAIRIAMDDDTASDAALAAATAGLSGDAAVPRETLLEFARKFAERSQHSAAAHAYLAAGCPSDAIDIVERHAVRGPPAQAPRPYPRLPVATSHPATTAGRCSSLLCVRQLRTLDCASHTGHNDVACILQRL